MNPRLLQVILGPVVSEKSTAAGETGTHVFRVRPDATKHEIQQAVEKIFEVKVQSVRTLNMAGKVKRFGGRLGRRNHWKKAYVSLAPGEKIELGEGDQV
ncbi:LSU ribosomal protein L23p (L23Ae) [Thioalkalivibrio nitratireducens DSM 14787]|uniref:Large ribosomal subunit protein uL23 n=1 Tax=Thioalkalivibrio nitratireducens (strain DSM 14787 / UNIQEM 213 / ALEN2) TaxID=1255043 RepID=L0DYT7_THIND|nr:50S ribosomal protein L23 [Thioalkalivibrio nitratireducens]AGA34213.1 LSU ribosomal protein L23p (L23Ae) [Thioalkalivibrio nitratireducens DSM 14787]